MALKLNEWFCFAGDRSSFKPRLPDDAHFMFCHEALRDDVLTSIEMRFATNDPIKMLLHGDWGVGKTHLTHHVNWWLDQHRQDYPARAVLIQIGDISKKSKFDEIVRPLLDSLGLEFLIDLVHKFRGKHPNIFQALRDYKIASHVADAFNKLLLAAPGQAPAEVVEQAFGYLKGRKPTAHGMGFGAVLEQSQDFVDVLTCVGEMHRAAYGYRLLFIADEAARLEGVEADEVTQSHWMNANKLIFDDQNQAFGFIYTVSGKQKTQLPKAIWDPQILNRLGDNSFQLKTLAVADVEKYVQRLVDKFVDRGRVSELVATGEIPKAQFTESSYPFTAGAFVAFLDHFKRTQENAKPRDISARLDELAFIAGKKAKRLIDEETLGNKNM